MKLARIFLIGLLPALLVGCASLRGDDEADPPVELTDFDARYSLNELWSQNTGSGLRTADMVLSPVLEGNVIFTADPRGRIMAFDKTNGRVLWRQDIDAHITGAVALTPDQRDLYLTTSPREGGEPNTPFHDGPPLDTRPVVEKSGNGPEAGVRFEHLLVR